MSAEVVFVSDLFEILARALPSIFSFREVKWREPWFFFSLLLLSWKKLCVQTIHKASFKKKNQQQERSQKWPIYFVLVWSQTSGLFAQQPLGMQHADEDFELEDDGQVDEFPEFESDDEIEANGGDGIEDEQSSEEEEIEEGESDDDDNPKGLVPDSESEESEADVTENLVQGMSHLQQSILHLWVEQTDNESNPSDDEVWNLTTNQLIQII